jgi:hypothetical protein
MDARIFLTTDDTDVHGWMDVTISKNIRGIRDIRGQSSVRIRSE